jgi:hypothetical protein
LDSAAIRELACPTIIVVTATAANERNGRRRDIEEDPEGVGFGK